MQNITQLIGCGSYLPDQIVTNADLAEKVDTSDDWIVARTGIEQRHIAREGENTSDLAYQAAIRALEHAGIEASELDLIVVGTASPDRTFPSVGVRIQHRLGMTSGVAFDVQAACSGFIYALTVANDMLLCGNFKTALVIGADTLTRLLNWEDRTTCVLFGDGAGAVVLRTQQIETKTSDSRGILSTHIHSDGRLEDLLYTNGGPSSTQSTGHIVMEGPEVFKHAVRNLAEVVKEALLANNLQDTDIDWLVPHQANKRIIDSTARKLKMPIEKVVLTVQNHANTSAASIPLALDTAVKDGRI